MRKCFFLFVYTVNPLFNVGGVYLIFKILEGALIRGRRLIEGCVYLIFLDFRGAFFWREALIRGTALNRGFTVNKCC